MWALLLTFAKLREVANSTINIKRRGQGASEEFTSNRIS